MVGSARMVPVRGHQAYESRWVSGCSQVVYGGDLGPSCQATGAAG